MTPQERFKFPLPFFTAAILLLMIILMIAVYFARIDRLPVEVLATPAPNLETAP